MRNLLEPASCERRLPLGVIVACLAITALTSGIGFAQNTGPAIASVSGSWPCYYKDGEIWYDCPTEVVGGQYVLGEPFGQPELTAVTEFEVPVPGGLYLDGTARCEGCQQLLEDWQLVLTRWDGSQWVGVFTGPGERFTACGGWDERCTDSGRQDSIQVEAGRYRLSAHTGYSVGGFGEIFPRTEIDLSVHLISAQPLTSSADGERAGEVEWVACQAVTEAAFEGSSADGVVRAIYSSETRPSSDSIRRAQFAGTVAECYGDQGLKLLSKDGKEIGRLRKGDHVDFGWRLQTTAGTTARLHLDLPTGEAIVIMRPGARIHIPPKKEKQSGIWLFLGRLLSRFKTRAEHDPPYIVETPNAIAGVAGTTFEVGFDEQTGITEAIVAEGEVELTCLAEPDVQVRVRAGKTARMSAECDAMLQTGGAEVDRVRRLAVWNPFGTSPSGVGGAAVPENLGCFKDGGESQGLEGRDIDGELIWMDDLTVERCVVACHERGYPYAGVQWGRACFCGDSYGRFGPADNCDMACVGNSRQICGGFYANSVYATGSAGSGIYDPGPSAANLITNGSFEEGPPVEQWRFVEPGSTDLPGWTVSRSNIDVARLVWKSADGERSVDLNGNSGAGELSQAFDTRPGRNYRLSFYLAGNPVLGAMDMRVLVTVGDQRRVFTFNTGGHSMQSMGWRQEELDFTATSTRTTLVFTSQSDHPPGAGPAIDDVRVTAVD